MDPSSHGQIHPGRHRRRRGAAGLLPLQPRERRWRGGRALIASPPPRQFRRPEGRMHAAITLLRPRSSCGIPPPSSSAGRPAASDPSPAATTTLISSPKPAEYEIYSDRKNALGNLEAGLTMATAVYAGAGTSSSRTASSPSTRLPSRSGLLHSYE